MISLLEVEKPILPVMNTEEMALVKQVTDRTTDLLWLTGSSALDGKDPDLTLASGLSRALMLEQPALRFAILDLGNSLKGSSESDLQSVYNHIEKALYRSDIPDDKEFIRSNGLLHVSRFVPDKGLNNHFSQRLLQKPIKKTLEEASPARLAIEKIGLMDTIYFQQELVAKSSPPGDYVDIDVKAVSLNAKVFKKISNSYTSINL